MFRLIILILLPSISLAAETIKPFTTDGCSVFPDGNNNNNAKWMACCVKHDYAYWKGGIKSEREQADLELKECVADLDERNIASVMHLGVRLGGEPFYPVWYRWGYGWPYARGYKPLSEIEKQQVKSRMIELRDLIDRFVEDSD